MNLVTLDRTWTSKRLGTTYPVGTVFMQHPFKEGVWTYQTPQGAEGTCSLGVEVPGVT